VSEGVQTNYIHDAYHVGYKIAMAWSIEQTDTLARCLKVVDANVHRDTAASFFGVCVHYPGVGERGFAFSSCICLKSDDRYQLYDKSSRGIRSISKQQYPRTCAFVVALRGPVDTIDGP